jgi:hypothetical protein
MIYKYFVAALLVMLPCAECVELTATSLAQEDATMIVSPNSSCWNEEQPSESTEEASPVVEQPSPVAEQPSESTEEASPIATCSGYTPP